MKKKDFNILIQLLLSAVLCLSMAGCKTGSNYFREPFADYRSDALFFRSVGQGNDSDIQRAKSKATHDAKVEIARNAHSVCHQIVLDYINQTGNNNNINTEEQFISVSMESVSESMVNVIVEDTVYKKNKDNTYTCYAMVKVQKSNVFETLENHLQDKKDINTELFKQVVDRVVNQINTK